AHHLKQQDAAEMLGLNVSIFSQIMNGKRSISVSLAKKLYSQLHISAELIIENI
ncbi:MAG: helix-turn-helix domain-containing protein, partial [Paludibacteraceae bacterium]|nr:helix-turn-helix domain-containing protein [Paludibacteraceae bacterium]